MVSGPVPTFGAVQVNFQLTLFGMVRFTIAWQSPPRNVVPVLLVTYVLGG